MTPTITVLMAVYNGEKYLRPAIDSILSQTFQNFEFLIINDGSIDETVAIIESYCDSRIRLVHNTHNLGLVKSLNKGISLAKGEYIARMDADEVCLPERFEKQLKFLQENPTVGVCGTHARTIGDIKTEFKYPIEHDHIRANLLFLCCIVHASVMMRKIVLLDNKLQYDEQFRHAEDYEFWVRLSKITRLANIPEYLLLHRMHKESIGSMNPTYQERIADKIRLIQLEALGIDLSDEELKIHRRLGTHRYKYRHWFVKDVCSWFVKLTTANNKKKIYPETIFSEVLGWHLQTMFSQLDKPDLLATKNVLLFPLATIRKVSLKRRLSYILRSQRFDRNFF